MSYRKSSEDDVHGQDDQIQFRYMVIPTEIINLVIDDTITRSQAWLLAIIDSFVRMGGIGCYVSNKKLAALCNVKVRQVQNDLEKLRKLGLVVDSEVQFKLRGQTMRTIESSWAKTTAVELKTTPNPMQKTAHPPCSKLHTPHAENCTRVKESDKKKPPLPPRGESEEKPTPSKPTLLHPRGTPPTETWEATQAKRLYAVVTEKHGERRSWSQREWSSSFAKLLKRCDGDKEQVEEVLAYYESNWREWKVFSASSFVRLFDVMQAKARRSKPQPKMKAIPDKKTLLIVNEVLDLGWPAAAKVGLSDAVAESHGRMTQALAALKEIEKDADTYTHDLRRVADYVLTTVGHDPEAATLRWFKNVLKDVAKWKEWGGSFKSFSFDPSGPRFAKLVNEEAVRFAGSRWGGELADTLITSLNNVLRS